MQLYTLHLYSLIQYNYFQGDGWLGWFDVRRKVPGPCTETHFMQGLLHGLHFVVALLLDATDFPGLLGAVMTDMLHPWACVKPVRRAAPSHWRKPHSQPANIFPLNCFTFLSISPHLNLSWPFCPLPLPLPLPTMTAPFQQYVCLLL